jgi:hypothetical protein
MNDKMIRREWARFGLPLMLMWTCALHSQTVAPRVDAEPSVSVRISTDRVQFRLGEDVILHVEIWNEGRENLFINKEISIASNALAKLALIAYRGQKAIGPMFSVAVDCFCSERSTYPPLASELPRYWIAVPPQHFYGGVVVMHASDFGLKTPGKYRIQGKYNSRGFFAEDINNPLAHYAEELKALPYQVWIGEVESNSIWINVTHKP